MRKISLLAIMLLTFSCSGSGDDAPEDSRLVFASTITGKVVILGADDLLEKATVIRGHTATIGVAALPGQRSFYYGNQDTNTLELLKLNDDWTVEVEKEFEAPGPIKAIVSTLDASLLAISSESASVDVFDDQVHFFKGTEDSGEWIGNYAIPTEFAERTEDGELVLSCPCPRPGVALSPAGTHALVTHMHEHTAALMNPYQPDEATVVTLAPLDDANPWLGPSAFSEFSFDGTLVGIPGMQAQRLYLMPVDDPQNPTSIDFPGSLPFDVAFSADSQKAYVATVDEVPDEGQEFLNAQIPSALHVVDLSSMTVIQTIALDIATFHVTTPVEGDLIFLGSSFSGVMSYKTDELLPYASINLSATPMPLMEIDL